jgi:predicted 2-oxoglutarate/Fe(II)-dependent dioxygenase YbiX
VSELDEIGQLRVIATRAPWVDGASTASGHAAQQKKNEQVDETSLDGDIDRPAGDERAASAIRCSPAPRCRARARSR